MSSDTKYVFISVFLGTLVTFQGRERYWNFGNFYNFIINNFDNFIINTTFIFILNNHQLKELLIFEQILHVSTLGNV